MELKKDVKTHLGTICDDINWEGRRGLYSNGGKTGRESSVGGERVVNYVCGQLSFYMIEKD